MLKKFIIILLLLFFAKEMLVNSNIVFSTINYSIDLWIKNILPSFFPFFILSYLLINYDCFSFVIKLLHIKNPIFVLFLTSIIIGCPNNVLLIKELYLNKQIKKEEINKLIVSTCFVNSLFIIGTVSNIYLLSKKMGILILISQILSNLLIFICYSKKCKLYIANKYENNNNKSFIDILSDGILKAFNSLFIILGIVIFFMLIINIIVKNIHIGDFSRCIISGTLEMTQGLKCFSTYNIDIKFKAILMNMLISFGGISIHLQIKSFLQNTDFNYRLFLITRLINILLSSSILWLFT